MGEKRLHLLIADDDADVREWLRLSLEDSAETILEAADGKELEDMLLGGAHIQMPKKSGLEATRAARQSGVEVPIIFITGFLDRKLLDEITAIGKAAVLLKPFEIGELERQIDTLLGRSGSGNTPAVALLRY